jgi:hypothetical protein
MPFPLLLNGTKRMSNAEGVVPFDVTVPNVARIYDYLLGGCVSEEPGQTSALGSVVIGTS